MFLSFEESRRFFKSKKVVMSGNPVRRALVETSKPRAPATPPPEPPPCHAFISDMADAYRAADLVIVRAPRSPSSPSPASTAIFIPYPFAANNHQELNAREMAEAAAAAIFDWCEAQARA